MKRKSEKGEQTKEAAAKGKGEEVEHGEDEHECEGQGKWRGVAHHCFENPAALGPEPFRSPASFPKPFSHLWEGLTPSQYPSPGAFQSSAWILPGTSRHPLKLYLKNDAIKRRPNFPQREYNSDLEPQALHFGSPFGASLGSGRKSGNLVLAYTGTLLRPSGRTLKSIKTKL